MYVCVYIYIYIYIYICIHKAPLRRSWLTLAEFFLGQKSLSRDSIYRYAREQQGGGTVSSNSRFRTVLLQQYVCMYMYVCMYVYIYIYICIMPRRGRAASPPSPLLY